jgi:hypothetical protein
VLKAATTGFFSYDEPSCGTGLVQGGNNVATGLVGAGLGSVPVVGGVLKTIFGGFTAHHKQAVATEQKTLCQAVPDANNFLRSVDAAISTGQLTLQAALQTLEEGYTNWRANLTPILKDTGGKCNAACVFEKCFRAAIEKRKQDYAVIAAQQSQGAQGVFGGVVNAITGAVNSLTGGSSPQSALAASSLGSSNGLVGISSQPQVVILLVVVVGTVLVAGIFYAIGGKKQ